MCLTSCVDTSHNRLAKETLISGQRHVLALYMPLRWAVGLWDKEIGMPISSHKRFGSELAPGPGDTDWLLAAPALTAVAC